MDDFDYIPVVKEVRENSHQVYLDNWETKTRFAENNCEWNSDIQHRVHLAIESLASNVDILAYALADALARIATLEAQVQTQ